MTDIALNKVPEGPCVSMRTALRMQPRSTRHAYDAIAEQWHHHPRPFSSRPYVDALIAALQPGAPLLDDPSFRGHTAVLATRIQEL